jgi:hypothetical protein
MAHIDEGCAWNLGAPNVLASIRNSLLHHHLKSKGIGATSKAKLGERELTHTCFDGLIHGHGVLSLADEFLDFVYIEYANTWSNELFPLYFNEMTSADPEAPRPFASDFDFYFEDHVGPFDLHVVFGELFTILQTCVREVIWRGAPDDLLLVVGSSGLTHTTKGEARLTKLGLHLDWPELIITQPQSITIRRCLIEALVRRYHEQPTFATPDGRPLKCGDHWTTILDSAPLVRNPQSLRMFGSRKVERRTKPQGEANKNCMCVIDMSDQRARRGMAVANCRCFRGKLRDLGRQLELACVYKGANANAAALLHFQSHKFELLKLVSLRPLDRQLVAIDVATDYLAAMFEQQYNERPDGKPGAGGNGDGVGGGKSKKARVSDIKRALIINYIRNRFPQYITDSGANLNVNYIRAKQKFEIILDSKRCDNAYTEYHTSKKSYIWVSGASLSLFLVAAESHRRLL